MTGIATLDLARFRIDDESFLGQTLSLGIRFRKLPEHTGEALLTYLRARSMGHAAKTRSGIALAKEDLERSVRQAMVCLEMGLVEEAEGDLNRAVDCLVGGDFESIRKRGYQTAYDRLENMQRVSAVLAEAIPGGLLKTERLDLERWGKVVPETWTRPAEEGEDVDPFVDPTKELDRFELTRTRAELLVSLPGKVLSDLDEVAGDEGTWDAILRNLLLAVALDRETLIPDDAGLARFEEECFEGGTLRPEIGEKILQQIRARLNSLGVDADISEAICADVISEIDRLGLAVDKGLSGFFLMASEAD